MLRRLALLACLALVACGGDEHKHDNTHDDGDSDGGDPGGPTYITVSGRALNAVGFADPNVTVRLWSAGADASLNAIADGAGGFTFDNVIAPYDVLLVSDQASTLFLGLTRTDPQLVSLADLLPAATTSEISGGVGPDPAPVDKPNTSNIVAAICPGSFYFENVPGDHDDYDGFLVGNVSAGDTCDVSVLRYNKDTAVPTTWGYLTKSAVAINVGDSTGVNLETIATLPTHNVTVTLDVAPGIIDLNGALAWAPPGGHYGQEIKPLPAPVGVSQLLHVPETARIALVVGGNVNAANAFAFSTIVLDPTVATMTLTLKAGISAVSPLGPAPIDASAETFTIVGQTNQVYSYMFKPTSGTPITVVTTSKTLSASVLAPHGLALARDADYAWTVSALNDIASVDAYADGSLILVSELIQTLSGSGTNSVTVHTAP